MRAVEVSRESSSRINWTLKTSFYKEIICVKCVSCVPSTLNTKQIDPDNFKLILPCQKNSNTSHGNIVHSDIRSRII